MLTANVDLPTPPLLLMKETSFPQWTGPRIVTAEAFDELAQVNCRHRTSQEVPDSRAECLNQDRAFGDFVTEEFRPESRDAERVGRDGGQVRNDGLEPGQVESHLNDRQVRMPIAGRLHRLPRVDHALHDSSLSRQRGQRRLALGR